MPNPARIVSYDEGGTRFVERDQSDEVRRVAGRAAYAELVGCATHRAARGADVVALGMLGAVILACGRRASRYVHRRRRG